MKKLLISLIVLSLWSINSYAAPLTQSINVSVDEVVVDGLDNPVYVTHAGDGSGRLFVVEKAGRIVVSDNGTPSTFLDISAQVRSIGSEQGLLGLAFHPQYATNGYFYVNYIGTDGDTYVSRYEVSSGDANAANPDSETVLLTVDQPFANHNGGHVAFGPDGYLYIGLGDGGGGGDPDNNAQNTSNLLGAILRIDVDAEDPYGIPPDNPYMGQSGRDELWAIGLRNPWRFSFDRLNGDLFIGDVGQNAWEEVNYQANGTPGGMNFGWPCFEGVGVYDGYDGDCSSQTTLQAPIIQYSHDEGFSITGGYVYRGVQYPQLYGLYFYGDWANGKIWSITQTSPGIWTEPTLVLETNFRISSFGEDAAGELYVVEYSLSNGTVRRITQETP